MLTRVWFKSFLQHQRL